MDEDDFEHTFLVTMVTLAAGLRYMMAARPLEDDDPPGEEAPTETKPEKVVAIGGKKA